MSLLYFSTCNLEETMTNNLTSRYFRANWMALCFGHNISYFCYMGWPNYCRLANHRIDMHDRKTDLKIFSWLKLFLLLKFTHFLLFSAQFELFYLDFSRFQLFWAFSAFLSIFSVFDKGHFHEYDIWWWWIFSDFNKIILWHKSTDIKKKRLFPKFQLILIFRLQIMHDYVH